MRAQFIYEKFIWDSDSLDDMNIGNPFYKIANILFNSEIIKFKLHSEFFVKQKEWYILSPLKEIYQKNNFIEYLRKNFDQLEHKYGGVNVNFTDKDAFQNNDHDHTHLYIYFFDGQEYARKFLKDFNEIVNDLQAK